MANARELNEGVETRALKIKKEPRPEEKAQQQGREGDADFKFLDVAGIEAYGPRRGEEDDDGEGPEG